MRIGIVSGYFNPLHLGHLEYIEAAKAQCDFLIVIVNNDDQVKLKGSKQFMDELHRKRIVGALKPVDEVWLAWDKDRTVCKTIQMIRNDHPKEDVSFFNSGDRVGDNVESAEVILCRQLGIKYVAIPLPKRYSSSKLLENL